MNNLLILIVEDDPSQRGYLTNLLTQSKFNVIAANSGEQALGLIEGKKIDLALLDINLGQGMDGIELSKTLRISASCSNIPIIAVTAYYNKEYFLHHGFDDFIQKPYTYDQLISVINSNAVMQSNKINMTYLSGSNQGSL
ncbi:MAG: response regulator [Candidatus Neomarinimicrobiota bacterium]